MKVQRPGVREQIALDVYILRAAAGLLRDWRKLNRCAAPTVALNPGSKLAQLDSIMEACSTTDLFDRFVRRATSRGVASYAKHAAVLVALSGAVEAAVLQSSLSTTLPLSYFCGQPSLLNESTDAS